MAYLEKFGTIDRLSLPEAWKLAPDQDELGELLTYYHPTEAAVSMSFFYRGKPLSSYSSKYLHKILAAAPHELKSEERLEIETVLRDAAEPEYFDLKSLSTIKINERTVLFAEGYWNLSDLNGAAWFISSAEDDGCRVDEIHYLAPKEKFPTYLAAVQDSLRSIRWQC